MIREAAEKTGETVGDGTSTSAILAHAIFGEGATSRPVQVVVATVKVISRAVISRKELAQVVSIWTCGRLVSSIRRKRSAWLSKTPSPSLAFCC